MLHGQAHYARALVFNVLVLTGMRIFCSKWAALLVAAFWCLGAQGQASKPTQEKVLRYGFQIAETGFDPAQVSDLYSVTVNAHIFDSLYTFDYLAPGNMVVPSLAQGMPEVSADFKTLTIKIKQGIYFADDEAFKGKRREVVAADVVYSFKRIADPKTKSQSYPDLEQDYLLGLEELRAAAEKPGGKFDYDKEIEGVRALDRYTVQFKLKLVRPRFIYRLARPGTFGTVAREVVEYYGDKIMEHPVGSGPFVLERDKWRRSSKIVLKKSPTYREEYYDGHPAPDDAKGQELLRRFKGKRIPMVDRVEVSIIEENQPRWLSFLGNELDFLERLPNAFAYQVIPNNKLAPNLAKRGIVMERVAAPDVTVTYFNMEDPIVGGYTPDKIGLRRAIALAYDTFSEIRLPRRNQAILAQGPIQPATYGYDPKFKTEMSEFDRPKAMALLDMYGYVDKDGDGWRDMPDGSPLTLEYATQPDAASRELNEIWKKSMNAVGIRIVFKTGKWPEQLKSARAGKLMMWGLGYSASAPDGEGALALGYGPGKGEDNLARFENAEFDRLYKLQQVMPDGPERLQVMQTLVKYMVAYMPYKFNSHRIFTDMSHPWLIGFRRHGVMRNWWQFVDIDTDKLPKK